MNFFYIPMYIFLVAVILLIVFDYLSIPYLIVSYIGGFIGYNVFWWFVIGTPSKHLHENGE